MGVVSFFIVYLYLITMKHFFRNDESLRQVAIEHFIEMPWSYGWDKNFGGFFYFLDTDGHSPIQLEWYSKLWWPHCEALIASLMAYRVTKNPQHWILFKQCFDYTVSHVSSLEADRDQDFML